MIVLPTKGRPLSLKRFVTAYLLTGGSLPVHVVFDAEDANAYENIGLPSGWKSISAPAGSNLGTIFNLLFKHFPNEPFYAMVADDCVPETEEWDVKLRDACLPGNIAWGDDGFQGPALPTFPFIGGDLIRKLGWWSPPNFKHSYIDDVWKALADALNIGVYLPDIKMTHLHHVNGKREKDKTDFDQPNPSLDKIAFDSFKRFELPGLLDRLRYAV